MLSALLLLALPVLGENSSNHLKFKAMNFPQPAELHMLWQEEQGGTLNNHVCSQIGVRLVEIGFSGQPSVVESAHNRAPYCHAEGAELSIQIDFSQYRVQPFRTYRVCILVKSSPGFFDPENLVENCAPKFSIEKAVPYKPHAAPKLLTPETSEDSILNQPEVEEEEYSYSDSDYSHLYKKLSNTYDDEAVASAEAGKAASKESDDFGDVIDPEKFMDDDDDNEIDDYTEDEQAVEEEEQEEEDVRHRHHQDHQENQHHQHRENHHRHAHTEHEKHEQTHHEDYASDADEPPPSSSHRAITVPPQLEVSRHHAASSHVSGHVTGGADTKFGSNCLLVVLLIFTLLVLV